MTNHDSVDQGVDAAYQALGRAVMGADDGGRFWDGARAVLHVIGQLGPEPGSVGLDRLREIEQTHVEDA